MLGVRLFNHAFKMLFHDFGVTLRITMLPLLVGYGLVFGINYLLFGSGFFGLMTGVSNPNSADNSLYLSSLVLLIILLPTFCWSAVAWHRYVLLQERPTSLLPRFPIPEIGSYFWNGFKIVMVAIVALIPVSLLVSRFSAAFMSNPFAPPLVVLFIVVVLMLLASALFFRIALVLPASSIRRPMSLVDSWRATSGYFPAIAGVVVILATIRMVAGFFQGPGLVDLVAIVIVSWLNYALGVSMLTTLYGVCVEKRDI